MCGVALRAALVSCAVVRAAATPAAFNLTDVDGSNGFFVTNVPLEDNGGQSSTDIAFAGDWNADGVDDLLVGARWGVFNTENPPEYSSYIIYGNPDGFPSSFSANSIDGANGFAIKTSSTDIRFAPRPGDVNGDGIADVVLGSPSAADDAGEAYVIFGRAGGLGSPSFDVSTLDGANGFIIGGLSSVNVGKGLGHAVALADVNGDGLHDVLLTGTAADPDTADHMSVYVVYGSTTPFPSFFDVTKLNGNNGFVVTNMPSKGGDMSSSVAGAGDVNADGIGDMVVGVSSRDNYAGSAYVIFGSTSFASTLDVSSLDGTQGFAMYGLQSADEFGYAVTGGVDMNLDGVDDFAVTAYMESIIDGFNEGGVVYVVYGQAGGFGSTVDLSALDGTNGFRIEGMGWAGTSIASAADLNSDGVAGLILTSPLADGPAGFQAGALYAVFAVLGGPGSVLSLAALDGTNGYVIQGTSATDAINQCAAGGDLNGDGVADIALASVHFSYTAYSSDSVVLYGAAPPPSPPSPPPAHSSSSWQSSVTPTAWRYGSCGLCVKHRVEGNGGCVDRSSLSAFHHSTDGAGAAKYASAVCYCCSMQCRWHGVCRDFLTYSAERTEGTFAPPAGALETSVPGAQSLAFGAPTSFGLFTEALEACKAFAIPCNVYLSVHTSFSFYFNLGAGTGVARAPLVRIATPKGMDSSKVYFSTRGPATSEQASDVDVPTRVTALPEGSGLVVNAVVSWSPGASAAETSFALEAATIQLSTDVQAPDPSAGTMVANDQVVGIYLRTGASGVYDASTNSYPVVSGPVQVVFCSSEPMPTSLLTPGVTGACRVQIDTSTKDLTPSTLHAAADAATRTDASLRAWATTAGWGRAALAMAAVCAALAVLARARAGALCPSRVRAGGDDTTDLL